jgi:TolA-binding protein
MTSLRHTAVLVLAGLFVHTSASTHAAAEQPPAPPPQPAPSQTTAAAPTATADTVQAAPEEIAKSLLVLAQRNFARGDRDAAETAYVEALNTSGDATVTMEALLAYADFLRQTGRDTRAAAIYEKFIATYPSAPNTPMVYIFLGRTLRDMGAFNLAQARFYAVLNSTLAVSPENIQRYRDLAQLAKFEIAETYYQQGDFASAGKFFGRIKLLDLPPEDRARASFREAYAFYLDGKLEQAAAALRTYLDAYPQHSSNQEGRYLLCMSLRRLGLNQEALAETLTLLRSAHATADTERDRWTYWQRRTGNQLANDFYEQGDFTAALTIYQTLSDLRADPAWRWPALYQVGLCYERLRQADRAASVYRDILAESAAAEKAGTLPNGPTGEVRRMAEWRLGQIDWVGTVEASMRSYASPQSIIKPVSAAIK